MTVRHIAILVFLAFSVLSCWIGVLGMWRMREPIQALHYLALPALGGIALTVAVFLQTGLGQIAFKTCAIVVVLLAINSVVTHATARAFRVRELGHWEPRKGDPLEFVSKEGQL
jgi:multisubunit Na+/H+ antiporter MnhG subunit